MALGAIAALGAVYGAWLFVESVIAPAGCCGATWPLPNPMQAERLIGDNDPKRVNGPEQHAAALAITRSKPAFVGGWLRLAYADRLLHGALTSEGQNALDISYSITPYAGPFSPWRAYFILDNWSHAPKRVRDDALAEIKIIRTDPERKGQLADLARNVSDPQGRPMALLTGALPFPGLNIP